MMKEELIREFDDKEELKEFDDEGISVMKKSGWWGSLMMKEVWWWRRVDHQPHLHSLVHTIASVDELVPAS